MCALGMFDRLNRMFITHLHPDHVSGLFTLIQGMLIIGRRKPLEIFMPEEGIEPFRAMLKTVYLASKPHMVGDFEVNFIPLANGVVPNLNRGEMSVRAWPSDHFINDSVRGIEQRDAFGFSIESGGVRLVYTGDVSTTGCFEGELARGATLLCEAMHIDWDEVIQLARKHSLRQVIFTHVHPDRGPELEGFCEAREDVIAAVDGMKVAW